MSKSIRPRQLIALVCLLAALASSISAQSLLPEPPRKAVDMTVQPRSGRIVFVGSTGNPLSNGNLLQSALDAAQPGDTLTLETVTYQRAEGFYLKSKRAITIQPANACVLPPAGTRLLGPQFAGLLPKLIATNPNASALDFWMLHPPDTSIATSDVRVIGLELTSATNSSQVVKIGGGVWPTAAEQQPSGIIFERVYVHGLATANIRRGFVFNGSSLAVVDSWVEAHEIGADSQAICGWNGAGPFLIHNNYLAGAGENVMFGGADATVQGLVPSDGEICHNTFEKPWSWRPTDASYAGYHWTVKNLLEFKNAQRFLVHDNELRNCWAGDGQQGYGVDFTPRNQSGTNPWARVADIDFYRNTIAHVGTAFDVIGTDDEHPSGRLSRIRIRDSLLTDVKRGYGGWGAAFVFASGGSEDLIISGLTMIDHDGLVMALDGGPNARVTITRNRFTHGDYGIKGSGMEGNEALHTYFPGVEFSGNTLIGFPASLYSDFPDNSFQ